MYLHQKTHHIYNAYTVEPLYSGHCWGMAFWLLYGGGCCRGGSKFSAFWCMKKSSIVVCTEVLYACAHCKLVTCYYTRRQASGSRGNQQRSAVGQLRRLGSTRSGVLAVRLASPLSLAVVLCRGRLGQDCDAVSLVRVALLNAYPVPINASVAIVKMTCHYFYKVKRHNVRPREGGGSTARERG